MNKHADFAKQKFPWDFEDDKNVDIVELWLGIFKLWNQRLLFTVICVDLHIKLDWNISTTKW
jgi:hypothetical protein